MVLKKTLLISFLVLLIIPFVLAQNSDFTPNKPPAEKKLPEMRQGQDLDIEGLLSQVGLTQHHPPAGGEFMIIPDTGAMFGVRIHNEDIKYFYNDLNPSMYNGVAIADKTEWLRMMRLRMDNSRNIDDDTDDDPITINVAGRLKPLINTCKEDSIKLAQRVNEVKNMFLFRQSSDGGFISNVVCVDDSTPLLAEVLKPRFYDNNNEFDNSNTDFDKQIARGEWPSCTCTQDAVYCGYNLVYQCPKEKKLGFVETPSQQYAIIPMQDNYAYLPLIITIASALFIALMVLIVILKKK